MAGGYWGSRFPIGNFIISKTIFLMCAFRIGCLKLKNRVKGAISPSPAVRRNSPETGLLLKKWLDSGYDKFNIGGGPKELKGFVNIDFVGRLNLERQIVANILDLAFIPDESISQIHSNHVLEHLSLPDLRRQIREWHRILKKDGLLTLRCPNALGAAYGFWFEPVIESRKEEFIAAGFPEDEDFGNPADRWLHKDFYGLMHWFYGDAGNIANQHLTLLTPSEIRRMLTAEGFLVLKIAEPEAINIVVVARKGVSGG